MARKLTIKGIISAMGAVLIGIGTLQGSNTLIFIGTIVIVITSLVIAGFIKW